jgi:hypothetical protein
VFYHSYWCCLISNSHCWRSNSDPLGIFVHIIATIFAISCYEDRYKIKSRIFTCKYSRGFNWICIMHSIGYLYICKLYHPLLSISTMTSFQSNWNIDTIKILSSCNCYLTPMQFIKIIKSQPWLKYYANQNFRMHMSNVQGDTFWTSSSSNGEKVMYINDL